MLNKYQKLHLAINLQTIYAKGIDKSKEKVFNITLKRIFTENYSKDLLN